MQTSDSSTRSGSLVALSLAALSALTAGAAAQGPDVESLVIRVGERVLDFYKRAQSVMCTEKVTLQPINTDLSPLGFARVLEYELRLEWDASDTDGDVPDARMVRELRKVNGRAPRPKDEPGCTDPKTTAPDPLIMLLPRHRDEYMFAWGRARRFKDRAVTMLDYKLRNPPALKAKWDKKRDADCVEFTLPVRTKGRIWIDAVSHDVMRLDESLGSFYEYRLPREHERGDRTHVEFRRLETSIRYRTVAFRDPEETLMLPESVDTLMVVNGLQSYRRNQTFTNYRRFLTGARMVK